jgi:hypothetical protein
MENTVSSVYVIQNCKQTVYTQLLDDTVLPPKQYHSFGADPAISNIKFVKKEGSCIGGTSIRRLLEEGYFGEMAYSYNHDFGAMMEEGSLTFWPLQYRITRNIQLSTVVVFFFFFFFFFLLLRIVL